MYSGEGDDTAIQYNTSGIAPCRPELGLHVALANTATHRSVNGNCVCNQETLSVSWVALERRDLLDGALFLRMLLAPVSVIASQLMVVKKDHFKTGVRCGAETHNYSQRYANYGAGNLRRTADSACELFHVHPKVPACAIYC